MIKEFLWKISGAETVIDNLEDEIYKNTEDKIEMQQLKEENMKMEAIIRNQNKTFTKIYETANKYLSQNNYQNYTAGLNKVKELAKPYHE